MFERFKDLLLDHKNRGSFHFKKGKKKRGKKQHTGGRGGGGYVVEWGRAKKISPKDAMHLVVVL